MATQTTKVVCGDGLVTIVVSVVLGVLVVCLKVTGFVLNPAIWMVPPPRTTSWVIPLGLRREMARHRSMRRVSDRFQIAIKLFWVEYERRNKLAH